MLCTDCILSKHCLTNNIGGRGPDHAEIMLVGQGPGVQEDTAGIPFVGRAGKLLNEMMKDAGLDPESVYITNATRCRAPKDRKPLPEEINACRKWLKADIERVRPKVIVALSDTALQALCKKSGISGKRGQPLELHPDFGYECEVWPTYHPAFILRPGGAPYRRVVVTDLRKVRDRYRPDDKVDWNWQDEFKHLGTKMALDIETIDADGKIVDYPTQMAVAMDCIDVEQNAIVRATQKPDTWKELSPNQRQLITHNGWTFDLPVLERAGHTWPSAFRGNRNRDTMVMAYLCDETQPRNLEALCVKYLGVKGWKEGREARLGTEEFGLYNARDAMFTLRIHDVLEKELGPRVDIADKIMFPAHEAFRAASERGVFIDREEVLVAKKALEEQLAVSKAKIAELAPEVINPNATQQVAAELMRRGHSLPLTPSGDYQVGKRILNELKDEDEFAAAMLEYRGLAKKMSTYVKAYLKLADGPDGRAHTTYKILSTVVGRSSATGPNIQNLINVYDSFLSAPEGYTLLKADYNALHFRLAADVAGEQVIIDRYKEDPYWDPHRFFAAILYNKPEEEVTKDERKIAKSANFGLLYTGKPITLYEYMIRVAGIHLPYEECVRIHNLWHRTFPRFHKWYKEVEDEMREFGYVETLTGRRRHLGDVKLMRGPAYEAAKREAVNFKVLGLEPDVAFTGFARCHQIGLPVNYFCHDSVGAEVKNEEVEVSKGYMEQAMTQYPIQFLKEHFGVELKVPLVVEFSA